MARTAGELTTTIRDLLAKAKGKLSYGDARPLLEKAGFELPEAGSDEFKAQRNAYNVTAYLWRKNQTTGSKKPAVKAKAKVTKTAKVAPKPKHKPVGAPEVDLQSAFQLVRKVGGRKACTTRIESLREEIAEIEAALKAVTSVEAELAEVA